MKEVVKKLLIKRGLIFYLLMGSRPGRISQLSHSHKWAQLKDLVSLELHLISQQVKKLQRVLSVKIQKKLWLKSPKWSEDNPPITKKFKSLPVKSLSLPSHLVAA